MATQPFPFITDGIHGDVPSGFYVAKDSERQAILLPTPGIKEICQLPNSGELRGVWSWGSYMYWVSRQGGASTLWRVNSGGAFSELGPIPTSFTGPVWLRNNSTQLCIVDGVTGYVYIPTGGGLVPITDPDFPGASSLDYQDGYGLFTKPNSNQWFFSSLYDFKAFDALDFYTKESMPDNIAGIFSFRREPYIFGDKLGTEVWYNAGGNNTSVQDPTFARNAGGLLNYGCGAIGSVSDLSGEGVIFLSSERQLVRVGGYHGQVVSNQMFDREVKTYATVSDARAFSFRMEGHVFYWISFPTANVTWVYDATTNLIQKVKSYLEVGGYGRHRANCYVLHQGQHFVGDYANGKIYKLSTDYLDDNGHYIQRQVYSQEADGGLDRLSFKSVQVVVEAGVGLSGGVDPQIGLEFTTDSGHTWTNQVTRGAGLIGEYSRMAIWHCQGASFRRQYRLTFTDPVLWRILGVDFGIA